eukprot:6179412-Pleurochrysis_carterae.AAC.2
MLRARFGGHLVNVRVSGCSAASQVWDESYFLLEAVRASQDPTTLSPSRCVRLECAIPKTHALHACAPTADCALSAQCTPNSPKGNAARARAHRVEGDARTRARATARLPSGAARTLRFGAGRLSHLSMPEMLHEAPFSLARVDDCQVQQVVASRIGWLKGQGGKSSSRVYGSWIGG